MKKLLLAALVSSAFIAPMASAAYDAEISYTFTQSGSHYVFDFTVKNTSTDAVSVKSLDFFQIDFDADSSYSNYSNISWVASNGWLTDAIPPVVGFGNDLPGSVTADDSALFGAGGGGIATGDSITGFQVAFDYTGTLTPYDHLFSWYAEFGIVDPSDPCLLCTPVIDPITGQVDYKLYGQANGTVIAPQNPGGGNPPPPGLPEPGILFLMGGGLLGLVASRRRRNRA